MGQCASRSDAAVATLESRNHVKISSIDDHRDHLLKECSVTCSMAWEDPSLSLTTGADPFVKRPVDEVSVVEEESTLECEEGEQQEEVEEMAEEEEELESTSVRLPRDIAPAPKISVSEATVTWIRCSSTKPLGETARQLKDWNSELDDSFSTLGDQMEDTHSEPTNDVRCCCAEQQVPACTLQEVGHANSITANETCDPTTPKHCRRGSDPMNSSWSDLNTSNNHHAHSVRRRASSNSSACHNDESMNSFGEASTSLLPANFTSRRGSVSSWAGMTLNMSSSTNGSSSINPYGFSVSSGRPSTASSSVLKEPHHHQRRLSDRSPQRVGPTGRRYSMTPSVDTLSENGDSDWNDSDLTSLISMDPRDLVAPPQECC